MLASRHSLAIVAVVIWAPLLLGILPLPSAKSHEIAAYAESAAHNSLSRNDSADMNREFHERTAAEWKAALTREIWIGWGENLLIASLGIWFACRTYLGRPYWRTCIVSLSIIALVLNVPGIVAMYATFDSLDQVIQFWFSVVPMIQNEGRWGHGYYVFIWPVLHIALIAVTIANWLMRKTREPIAA